MVKTAFSDANIKSGHLLCGCVIAQFYRSSLVLATLEVVLAMVVAVDMAVAVVVATVVAVVVAKAVASLSFQKT